jgi:hypothetical protein
MALNCFLKSAEPIKSYKVLVGAFVGNVGKNVGKYGQSYGQISPTNNFAVDRKLSEFRSRVKKIRAVIYANQY